MNKEKTATERKRDTLVKRISNEEEEEDSDRKEKRYAYRAYL